MKIEHLNNVIYQKIANFMDILILGLVNPNLVRHISKKFQKTEKKSGIYYSGICYFFILLKMFFQ